VPPLEPAIPTVGASSTDLRSEDARPPSRSLESLAALRPPRRWKLPAATWPDEPLPHRLARMLEGVSRRTGAAWPLLLQALRDRGARTTTRPALRRLARQIRRESLQPDPIARVYEGAGLRAVTESLGEAGPELARRVLEEPRLQLSPTGRDDVARGTIDSRVLVAMLYLARSHGAVTISCLRTGHRLYARPGKVSAHVYGRAVDVSAVDGVPIYGHDGPGDVTERAVHELLDLPPAFRPAQVISLLALGGPSFAQDDHDDHIHVGY
jgi:hypothetical protein